MTADYITLTRTSSAEFQVALQEQFHCILIANLELRLPYGRDSISVWKRTKYVPARIYSSHDSCNNTESSLDHLSGGGSTGYLAGATDSGTDDDTGSDEERDWDDGEDSGDDEEDEEDKEKDEEEDGESSGLPILKHFNVADAVTYMSIADLNKLRESSVPEASKKKGAASASEGEKFKGSIRRSHVDCMLFFWIVLF